jgi:hypothetical protein
MLFRVKGTTRADAEKTDLSVATLERSARPARPGETEYTPRGFSPESIAAARALADEMLRDALNMFEALAELEEMVPARSMLSPRSRRLEKGTTTSSPIVVAEES